MAPELGSLRLTVDCPNLQNALTNLHNISTYQRRLVLNTYLLTECFYQHYSTYWQKSTIRSFMRNGLLTCFSFRSFNDAMMTSVTVTFCVSRRRREMYTGHGRLCVCLSVICLSLAAFPHYCADPDVTWRNGTGVPSSCALLGGFAIGARVSLLRQLAPNTKCQRVRVLARSAYLYSQISESAVVTVQRRTQRDRAIVSMNVVSRLCWFPADMRAAAHW